MVINILRERVMLAEIAADKPINHLKLIVTVELRQCCVTLRETSLDNTINLVDNISIKLRQTSCILARLFKLHETVRRSKNSNVSILPPFQ